MKIKASAVRFASKCMIVALPLFFFWGSARAGVWEDTVKAAEREGQVTVYIAGYGAIIDSGAFQKAYPKIKVVSVRGSGSQLTPRIATERRAGKTDCRRSAPGKRPYTGLRR